MAGLLLLALALVAPAARAAETELRLPVTRGEILEVDNFAGRVEVRSGPGAEVHLVARHGVDEEIVTRREDDVVALTSAAWAEGAESFEIDPERVVIRLEGEPALPGPVDYEIEAPPWLPVRVRGPLTSVEVTGRGGAVEVAVVRGTVRVVESLGSVAVTCLEGSVVLERSSGAMEVVGGATEVSLIEPAGELRVETTSGSIEIRGPGDQAVVEAVSVDGSIGWSGPVPAGGASLSTHTGDVTVALPARAGLRLEIRTLRGRLESPFGLELEEGPGVRHLGADLGADLGGGGGRLEIETFSGEVRFVPP